MPNNRVRKRDLPRESSTTTMTDKYIQDIFKARRISANQHRTFFDIYIEPAIATAMHTYELLCGAVVFVFAVLYSVIKRIYIPSNELAENIETARAPKEPKGKKGKKGKASPKPATPALQDNESVESESPSPTQPLTTQTPPPATSPSLIQEAVNTPDADDAQISPSQTPAVQVPLPSPATSPASEDDNISQPPNAAMHDEIESAEAPPSIPAIPSSVAEANTNVSIPSSILLSETKLLFELAGEDESEEATLVFAGLRRLRKCVQTDLRIDPGASRVPTLLNIIWNLHFAVAPDFSLPLQGSDVKRLRNSREIASVFLDRYGALLWPDEPQPAPHLLDRSLQFSRDGTVNPLRYQDWLALGITPPKKGGLTDMQISKLGIKMTKFVGLVYDLPIKKKMSVDWSAVALILDDLEVGEETLSGRFEELPGELRRQVLRLD